MVPLRPGCSSLISPSANVRILTTDGCVAMDKKGFVVTGASSAGGVNANHRQLFPFATRHPDVFAIGDVRAGSTKRVAVAVGEGAAVMPQIHNALVAESG